MGDGGTDERPGEQTPTDSGRDRVTELFSELPVMYVRTRATESGPVIADCNRQFADALGYDRSEVCGRRLAEFYTESSCRKLLEKGGYDRALADEFTREERALVRRNGSIVHTLLRAVPWTDGEGTVAGTHALFVDVTDRHERERTVAALHSATRELFQAADEESIAAATRDAAVEVLGYPMTTVRLLGADGRRLVSVASTSARREVLGDPEPTRIDAETPAARAYREDEPIVVEEVDDRSEWFGGSAMFLPLSGSGVLAIRSTEPAAFEETDAELAGILARSATAALERLERDRRLRQRETMLSSFLEVVREMLTATDTDTACETAVEAIADVFGMSIAAIWEHDPDADVLRPVASTEAARRLVGPIPTFDHESISWQAFVDGEPRQYGDVREAAVVHNPETPVRSELILPLGEFGVLNVGSTIPDDFEEVDVSLAGIVAATTEAVLERIDREAELARLEQAVEHATLAVYFTDVDGTIEYVNPAFEEITGYDAATARGRPATFLRARDGIDGASGAGVGPADHGRPADTPDTGQAAGHDPRWETISRGEHWQAEVRNRRATGQTYTAVETVAPILEDDATVGYVVVQEDVTERRRREQQVQILNRVLRHNIRNDLNLIVGRAAHLVQAVDDEEARGWARDVLATAEEWEAISAKVRRIERAFETDESPTYVDLTAVLERIRVELLESMPDAEFVLDVPPEGAVGVRGTLELALAELCENAAKHADRQSPTVTVSVDRRPDRPGWATVTVTDEGPGLPEQERAVLRHGRETSLVHGSGLGLWMVHMLVARAGGEVTIADADGGGTAVTITVPTDDA